MKQVTILTLLSVLSAAVAELPELTVYYFEDPPECYFGKPDVGNFQKVGKNYYALRRNNFTWVEALFDCAEDDSQLASIDTLEELNAITKYLQDIGGSDLIWVASFDQLSVGLFRWIATGKKIRQELWYPGEPSTNSAERCVHLWAKGPKGSYRLNNWQCNQKLFYLCQKKTPKGAVILMWP